jgi:hypothetical protein
MYKNRNELPNQRANIINPKDYWRRVIMNPRSRFEDFARFSVEFATPLEVFLANFATVRLDKN